MKFVDEFRDPALARQLVGQIRQGASQRWVLMDVCGGQTHSLLRYGIEDELSDAVELIHGPGCPVCVTPAPAIDFAQQLSQRADCVLASFGDMLRVPGSHQSLLDVRAAGANVKMVYSPIEAVKLAEQHPDKQVVFLAVGFETTAPATALAVLQAQARGLDNFSLLVAHVRVLPAMQALLNLPDNRVQGFLAAGHVCTITGFKEYDALVNEYRVPVVVTGFEPLDLLHGILTAVRQLENDAPAVANCYSRSARRDGNLPAMDGVMRVFEIVDMPWRGMGVIVGGGLRLRSEYSQFDAEQRFALAVASSATLPILPIEECLSGQVMSGQIKPPQCPHFALRCTPESPLGAPMVSSEGACAAYMRYHSSALEPRL